MRRSWCLFLAIGFVVGLVAVSGCRPEIPKSELGKQLDHVPNLPGMDEPYKLKYVPPVPEVMQKGLPQMPSLTSGDSKAKEGKGALKDAEKGQEKAKP